MDESLIVLSFGVLLLIIGFLFKFYVQGSKPIGKELMSPIRSPIRSPKRNPQPSPAGKRAENQGPKQYISKILILFGSQSGTAAKYSSLLAEEAEEWDFDAKVVDLEEYESYNLKENVCLFLMATYGEGDPTDNAKNFYKWLKEEAMDRESLKGLKFGVFGLGNTQYQHYNSMGRNTNKLLEDHGGERIFKYGEGDDNSSLEEDFINWKEGIWESLKESLTENKENKHEIPKKIIKKQIVVNPLNFKATDEKELDLLTYNHKSDELEFEFQTKKLLDSVEASVTLIKETRQNLNDGSTLHLEIDTTGTNIKYLTAQNLAIFPQNTQEKVEELAKILDYDLSQIIKIEMNADKINNKIKFPFPSPISIRTILTNFCDFQGPIMRRTLKELAQLDIPSDLKGKFELLASPEGKLDYKKEIEETKNNLFNLLTHYKIKLSLTEFISLTPRIAPRLFTISSSNLKFPNTLHVTASLLEEKLPNGQTKKGLISQYLESLQSDFAKGLQRKVAIYFNESHFKLPEDEKTPVIMIGPGTGVAPFRAFLQEREFQIAENKIKKEDLTMILYSGCRHSNGDYIYREEFKEYLDNGILKKLYMAFSRDQENKSYVQHLLKKNQQEVHEIMNIAKGSLYICGSTKMGKDVMEILEEILIEHDKLTKEEAKARLNELEGEKRLIKELWG